MGRAIHKIVRQIVPKLDDHLSDASIAGLLGHEVSVVERWVASGHLKACPHCRARKEALEGPRAERILQLYRSSTRGADLLPMRPRAVFAQWLELHLRHSAPREEWRFRPRLAGGRLFRLRPAFSISMALVFGVGMSAVFFWWQQRSLPHISANSLLVKAERWDKPGLSSRPSVVRQTVRIKAPGQTMDRSIYWDVAGKRKPRQATLSSGEARLRSSLDDAGVDWDRPMSASAYQTWHDHQHVRADSIARSRDHLLTLTTSVPEGLVSEESITVRDTDFHPVRRTVNFRDSGMVEIAELDFKVLSWGDIDASAFEAVGGISHSAPSRPAPAAPTFALPEMPSALQLDETELSVRLILSQFHADTGEQIEVHRSLQEIDVQGIVETDARKRELQTQLMSVPRVKIDLQSAADLKKNPLPNAEAVTIQAASLPDQPSPLETYLKQRGSSVDAINVLEQRLFSSALAISQETRAITELNTRFDTDRPMSVIASATLADLLYSHHDHLNAAVRQERSLLADLRAGSASPEETAAPAASSIVEMATRNRQLANELTQTNAPARRDAEAIVRDMSATLETLAVAARHTYGTSHIDSALKGKE